MHNGKIFPEGCTINLEDKDAQSLSNYLVPLSASSQERHLERSRETKDEDSNKNTDQKTNNKRSK